MQLMMLCSKSVMVLHICERAARTSQEQGVGRPDHTGIGGPLSLLGLTLVLSMLLLLLWVIFQRCRVGRI